MGRFNIFDSDSIVEGEKRRFPWWALLLCLAAGMLAGWLLVFKKGVCPKCGKYLGTNFPRLPDGVPNRCPHCGEKL